jgi:hypothetical protein
VRGEQEPESDLDILIEFEEAPSFFEYIRLEDYLSEILGVKVDLVMKSALKPAIGNISLRKLWLYEGKKGVSGLFIRFARFISILRQHLPKISRKYK